MNVSEAIAPKSDQLNAEDLLTGPRTVRISGVSAGSVEQPLVVHYEGENGRPWKPSKTMSRMMTAMWGMESDAWVGQSVTLFRNPDIMFGGQKVGGIEISHATGIERRFTAVLSVTRGKRKPFSVDVLEAPSPAKDSAVPEDLDLFLEVGAKRAAEGMDALKNWYAGLTKQMKAAVKPTLDAEWKQIAEQADAEGGEA